MLISGQVPERVDGTVPTDFAGQCRLVWSNVLAQLAHAAMSVTNLVKVTTFLASRMHAGENGSIRRETLDDHRRALTVVITDTFDVRWLLEIEAIAAR